MGLMNCKTCGRLFQRVSRDICPHCVRQEEEDFLKVSRFLREQPGATPQQVHEATDVALKTIYQFIREGRLIAANFPNMTYPCERCGLPISVGRFCAACADELKAQLSRLTQRETAAAGESGKKGDEFFTKNRFTRK
ncbi:TIGR03826 family flagellar region protein [Effusibacillus pohliae]|uniref:TIGR03826 family flagellar region protein n=1 Tax=Effusibacillus pohliae TaxID=232270 RepID=UPI000380081B|nr:TIGR03826 family flagellar region protein [Effusibacillus pohliae]